MANIQRIKFQNKKDTAFGFEIISLKDFFKYNNKSFITKTYRTEFYNMIYVTGGQCIHEIDFLEYTLTPGDFLIVSEKRAHRYADFDNDTEGYLIMFTEEFLCKFLADNIYKVRELFKHTYLNPNIKFSYEYELVLKKLLNTMVDIYKYDEFFNYNILASNFLTIILTISDSILRLNIESKKENDVFIQFTRLVEENIAVKKTVEEYANMLYLSKKTVNLMTRKAIGMSAKEYIIQQLILRIKLNLCFEQKNISEISNELGFTDTSNMTKFFKRYTGLTPREFRSKN